jgi:hypothetical protein
VEDGIWLEASRRGPISYRTDIASPHPSLVSSDRYLLIPVPGHFGYSIGDIYFIILNPDGTLIDELLGPFHGVPLVSYQKLANGLPSLLFEDDRAVGRVGRSIPDLQRVILDLSDVGRRVAIELAIESLELPFGEDSIRLPWPYGICGQWNIDPTGRLGFVASQRAAYLLQVDRTGAVEALWGQPLEPVAEARREVRGRSLFSRSGEALAISIVDRPYGENDLDIGRSRVWVLRLDPEGRVAEESHLRLDGAFYPIAISDAGRAVALATTTKMTVVSLPSQRIQAVDLAPIQEITVTEPSPDRIDTGQVDLVHGMANASVFESHRLLDDGSLELVSRIDLSAVPDRASKNPVRTATGDGSAVLATSIVRTKDSGKHVYYVLDRQRSMPQHVDTVLRPTPRSAYITLRSIPGRGKHLLVRGGFHELPEPASIGLQLLD